MSKSRTLGVMSMLFAVISAMFARRDNPTGLRDSPWPPGLPVCSRAGGATMATEYLGVKQVAERLGITSGGLLNLKLPEPDA